MKHIFFKEAWLSGQHISSRFWCAEFSHQNVVVIVVVVVIIVVIFFLIVVVVVFIVIVVVVIFVIIVIVVIVVAFVIVIIIICIFCCCIILEISFLFCFQKLYVIMDCSCMRTNRLSKEYEIFWCPCKFFQNSQKHPGVVKFNYCGCNIIIPN